MTATRSSWSKRRERLDDGRVRCCARGVVDGDHLTYRDVLERTGWLSTDPLVTRVSLTRMSEVWLIWVSCEVAVSPALHPAGHSAALVERGRHGCSGRSAAAPSRWSASRCRRCRSARDPVTTVMLMCSPSRVPASMVTDGLVDSVSPPPTTRAGSIRFYVHRRPAHQPAQLLGQAVVLLRHLGLTLGRVELLLQRHRRVSGCLPKCTSSVSGPDQRARPPSPPARPRRATALSSGCSGELEPLEW